MNKEENNNKTINAQLSNSKKVYDSNKLQVILYIIATLILLGSIVMIYMSNELSVLMVLIFIITILLVIKFLKFNIINFIMNFKI